jgi:hypothetical protein
MAADVAVLSDDNVWLQLGVGTDDARHADTDVGTNGGIRTNDRVVRDARRLGYDSRGRIRWPSNACLAVFPGKKFWYTRAMASSAFGRCSRVCRAPSRAGSRASASLDDENRRRTTHGLNDEPPVVQKENTIRLRARRRARLRDRRLGIAADEAQQLRPPAQRIRLLRTNGNSAAISTYGAPTLTRACRTAGHQSRSRRYFKGSRLSLHGRPRGEQGQVVVQDRRHLLRHRAS